MKLLPEEWQPVDVDELEPAAEIAVRSNRSLLVTAGPGAGKTELLAQRGCYLLQTGLCFSPRKILAVSFKVDAAANLRHRVERRCDDDARRFHSVTLDAFAKGLVDRFRMGIPTEYRPAARFAPRLVTPRDAELSSFLQELSPPQELGGTAELAAIQRSAFYKNDVVGDPLPWPDEERRSLTGWAASKYWRDAIHASGAEDGTLTFPMIARLAELILRVNPAITRALRAAYPFVFLDEFQDMMPWHYDILRQAFLGSGACITAVGDTKQRIMLWAGAHPHVFEEFVQDFEAGTEELRRNYRSASELVRIQNELARLLEDDPAACEAASNSEREGVCQVLECDDADAESEWIADQVEAGMEEGLSADDFCLIYRQRVGMMSAPAIAALHAKGILARDETVYQDLADEVAVRIVTASIRGGVSRRDPDAWCELTELVRRIHGLSDDDARAEAISAEAMAEARVQFLRDPTGSDEIQAACNTVLTTIDRSVLQQAVPAYSRTAWLDIVIEKMAGLLASDRGASADWGDTISRFQGMDTVKAMTIHKSKGLEYNTVIFVGLEDSSWWAYARQEEEERRAFFVAFSRAIERVVFTFARRRDAGRGDQRQSRSGLRTLYDALEQAGANTLTV